MPVNSCQKGKAGERELAALLRDHGFTEAHRGRQYKGTSDSPDVVGVPGTHIECKRVARLGRLYNWLEKAETECHVEDDPVVFARGNRERWVVIMDAKDYLDRMTELLELRKQKGNP
jgi:Holliday junction resolvase